MRLSSDALVECSRMNTSMRLRQALAAHVLVCLCGTWQAARAAESGYVPPITFLRDEISYDVRADGTYDFEKFESIRLNNEQGVKQSSQVPLRFSASLQDLEVLEAYTLAKDGRRIDVEPDKIMLQQSATSAGAPMFDDSKVRTVIFPTTEVGAVINLRWRMIQKTPLFPGAFSMSQVFAQTAEFESAEVNLQAPESLKLYIDASGLRSGEPAAHPKGTKAWRWTLENAQARAPEPGSVGAYDFSPRVEATSFTNFEMAGKAYQDRARPKAAVTPAIQQLADEITKDVADRRSKAEALYQWVSSQVRYVAVFLGTGGVVPHDAETIARVKYGDCKDHVTLLEALLSAEGIQSSPVLVNLGSVYALPNVAVTPGVFNHAITYLPEFDVYVDSTVGVAPFGVLPALERGKAALVTDYGRGTAKLVTLPLSDPQHDAHRVETSLLANADGSIEGKSSVTTTGWLDLMSRQVAASIPPGLEAQFAARLFRTSGENGTGTYVLKGVKELATPFSYTSEFTLPHRLPPAPGAIAIPSGIGAFASIRSVAGALAAQPVRRFPAPQMGARHEEVTVLMLPSSINVRALPAPAMVESSVGRYQSSYVQSGNQVIIQRTLEVNTTKAVMDPEDHQKLYALGESVLRDLGAQLLY